MSRDIHIIIAEPAAIIFEGLASIFLKSGLKPHVSKAESLDEIIAEIAATRVTERGGRYDDKRSEAAMEDRKKEGYF